MLGESKWFTYTETEKDEILLDSENSSKNPDILFTNKTLTRDEVYAEGIVWIFKNSTESPVMHVPGRPADTTYDTTVDIDTVAAFNEHYYRGDTGTPGS